MSVVNKIRSADKIIVYLILLSSSIINISQKHHEGVTKRV